MIPKNLRPLVPYLKRYRIGLFWGGLCVLFNNGIWILFPLVIRRAIDDLQPGRQPAQTADLLPHTAGHRRRQRHLPVSHPLDHDRSFARIEFDLRNDLFAHLERLSYSFYQRTRTGDIMARATNDLNAVRMLLGPGIMYTANTVVFTAGALVFMLSISPRLTLYAFAAVAHLQHRRAVLRAQDSRTLRAHPGHVLRHLGPRPGELFRRPPDSRLRAGRSRDRRTSKATIPSTLRRSLKLVRLMGMLWPTLETLLGVAVVIVLLVGGREVLLHRITVGDFVAFNTYMMQLTWPIIALGWVINIFQRGTASMGRIHNIMSEQPEITDAASVTERMRAESHRRLNAPISADLNPRRHRIPQPQLPLQRRARVLRTMASLKHPCLPASSLAIVGPTGSGKSTLVTLIPRIYDAAPGMVLIDGRPIREFPLAVSAAQHRLRSPGNVPVQRHHPRKHRLRRRARDATATKT